MKYFYISSFFKNTVKLFLIMYILNLMIGLLVKSYLSNNFIPIILLASLLGASVLTSKFKTVTLNILDSNEYFRRKLKTFINELDYEILSERGNTLKLGLKNKIKHFFMLGDDIITIKTNKDDIQFSGRKYIVDSIVDNIDA